MKMKSYEFDLEKEETLFRGERQLMERMIEKHHRVDPVLLRWIVTEILWKRNFVLRLSPQAFDSRRPISEMKSRPSLLMRPRRQVPRSLSSQAPNILCIFSWRLSRSRGHNETARVSTTVAFHNKARPLLHRTN